MNPAPFEYVKVGSFEEVFDQVERHGGNARLLAGGQSLLPTLGTQLSAPIVLVDITGLDALRGVSVGGGDKLRIGALTTHAEVKASVEVSRHAPLLAQAMPHVAHPAIRNRGTFGGSLANADPAAELPACMVALEAELEVTGRNGTRCIPAADFFQGLYRTALRPGEILVAANITVLAAGYRSGFSEFARRDGNFAISALAAHACFEGKVASDVHLAFAGVDVKPVRCPSAEKIIEGKPVTAELLAGARERLAVDLAPPDDVHATANTKLRFAGVLLERVLLAMAA